MEEVESQLLEIEKHLMEITDHIVETRERPSMAISTVTGGLRNAPHPSEQKKKKRQFPEGRNICPLSFPHGIV